MNIGVCRIDLELPASHSLKDKRRVLRSIVARVQSRFNVAIAEVDQNDSWKAATLGITCVSNDSRHANAMLSSVVQFIQGCREEAVLADYPRCFPECRPRPCAHGPSYRYSSLVAGVQKGGRQGSGVECWFAHVVRQAHHERGGVFRSS